MVLGLAACKKTDKQLTSDVPDYNASEGQGSETETPSGSQGQGGATPTKAELPNAQYHISFYTSSDADQVESIGGLEAGAAIIAPEEPKRARYSFAGWYLDYGTWEQPFVFDKMPDNNVVLYAKWESSVDNSELEAYEADWNARSQNGHLYIHYLRFDNDPENYEKLNLWVWPKAFTGREFDWVRENGKVVVDEIGGAVCDIDMTQFYTGAGNDKDETLQFFKDGYYGANYQSEYMFDSTKYMDPELGFLIVYKGSKNSGTHWTSDCGNQYFRLEQGEGKAIREGGYIHVYAIQDNVGDFTFSVGEVGEVSNPYENDDGTNVSISNVNSSEDLSYMVKAVDTKIEDTVSGVGYQIMVASYADSNGDGYGDIRGIINNLDYIAGLGVDVIWLTPIQLSDSYHGYDIIDYKAVDPKFGTLDDYKELLTKCHQKNIKVIMDLVLNHTSVNNKWFQNSAKMVVAEEDGKTIDYRSFYHWRNWKNETLGKDWYKYSEYDYSYYGKFASSMPELNYDYQGTRDAILDVAEYWLGILGNGEGVDGFRIDAVKHIYMDDEVTPASTDIVIEDYDKSTDTYYNSNLTKNLNFFCWLIGSVKKNYPNAYFVGENFDGHAFRVAPYCTAFDGMLDFYMYYQWGQMGVYPSSADNIMGGKDGISDPIDGRNTGSLERGSWNLASMLEVYSRYGGEIINSIFSSNHDVPRLANFVVGHQEGSDIVAGELNSSNAETARNKATALLQAMATMPGINWIYYGDEIGMGSNYNPGEDKNSPNVDRQYRQPFKWETSATDQTAAYSISGDKTYYVTWDEAYNKTLAGVKEQEADPNSMLNKVKYWMNLKSTDPVLRYGSYEYKPVSFNSSGYPKESVMWSCLRKYEGKTYWCITNLSEYDYGGMQQVYGSGASNYSIKYISEGSDINTLKAYATIVLEIN